MQTQTLESGVTVRQRSHERCLYRGIEREYGKGVVLLVQAHCSRNHCGGQCIEHAGQSHLASQDLEQVVMIPSSFLSFGFDPTFETGLSF